VELERPIPMSIDRMTGAQFEQYVAEVLRRGGYEVEPTKATGDFGVDLVARRGAEIVAVQCSARDTPDL
jgi:restriction system protein